MCIGFLEMITDTKRYQMHFFLPMPFLESPLHFYDLVDCP